MTENPGIAVEDAAHRCLELTATWLNWDGQPCVSNDGDRVYTPHKAVRRIADHLIDHLAEVEAQLAGIETQPDAWHGSLLTLDSDWAHFTEADRDEAGQRLTRLAGPSRCAWRPQDPRSGTDRGGTAGRCARSPNI